MNTEKTRKQIKKLLLLDCTGCFMIAGASWVALLAARGFSAIQIGFAESIFHVASMSFEIPSGAIADVFGRKKTLLAGRVMAVIATVLMIFSDGFLSVAIAMVASAFSYNLASGTREALAYDTLKEAGIEREYDKFAANDMVIYQLTSSFATLLAGLALYLGYRRAYLADLAVTLASLWIAVGLKEVKSGLSEELGIVRRFKEVAHESAVFLKSNGAARRMIAFSALTSAVAVLILFFLQARLTSVGLKGIWLGPALFVMGLGSALGAKVNGAVKGKSYRKVGICCAIGVLICIISVFTGNIYLMVAGGFTGAVAESLLCVRTDVLLNSMIPSEQRATLISVNSFTYSVFMIVLSPVFGVLFS